MSKPQKEIKPGGCKGHKYDDQSRQNVQNAEPQTYQRIKTVILSLLKFRTPCKTNRPINTALTYALCSIELGYNTIVGIGQIL